MSWVISFSWAYLSGEECEASENYKMKKTLPTVGFEPTTLGLGSRRRFLQTTRYDNNNQLGLTCAIYIYLIYFVVYVAECFVLYSSHIASISFCFSNFGPIQMFADCKVLTKCNTRQNILLHM